jgi:hypothetical protein
VNQKKFRNLLSLVGTWKMGHGHEQVQVLLFQMTICPLYLQRLLKNKIDAPREKGTKKHASDKQTTDLKS